VATKQPPVTSASPGRSAGALAALVAALALTAQSPAPAATPLPWCTRIPIAHAAACRPLEVRTQRGTLRLAVANTELQREHGLMNVPFVPAGQGMIFVFSDGDLDRGFWMKDTITPLDMIFVRRDGTVSNVEVNVPATPPKTPDERVARRNGAGQYVIELGAGQAGQFGLLPGSRLVIPPVTAQ
jgi:uncharacterized membrane protein (UPF0127 family)